MRSLITLYFSELKIRKRKYVKITRKNVKKCVGHMKRTIFV